MLKNIIDELKKYDEARQSVETDNQRLLASITKEYAVGGDTYNQMMQEAKMQYEKSIKALTDKVTDSIKSIFTDTIKEVTDHATAPMDEKTRCIIDSLNVIGSGLTPSECDIYADSVKDNYIATKMFAPIYRAVKGVEMHYVALDDVMHGIDETRSEVQGWIDHFNPDSYSHAVMVADSSPINDADKLISEFLNKCG